ncbi:hypothetical protein [Bacteroides sp. 519]|uniref:hypothetical protein n=1 Tax=Bacteroides sp. 519 TaxID=2302937 RepID=UPI0013D68E21|nr:hypothetical protein [Bacteroides sp. 519]NDV59123.1 hypothetical protein [Bacteroides sp. 519]
MKNSLKYIAGVLIAGLAMTACSPEEFTGASEAGIPKLADYKPVVSVDQETNIATFSITTNDGEAAKGVYPIWTINADKTIKTTVNGYRTAVITLAGDYTYSLKVGNKNGISDASTEGLFTINTTRYDFSDAVSKLTNKDTKEWRVYSAKTGHLGCGPSPTDPAGWWAAGEEEKAREGMYDDRISFTTGEKLSEGTYKYSAGEDELTFCNAGVTTLGVTGAEGDYSTPCVGVNGALSEVTYNLGYNAELDCVTITLPAKTLFPYIANDAQMNGEITYLVTELTSKTMTLVIDLPGISWQIILVNGDDEAVEEGFDPEKVNWCTVDAPENLGAGFNTKGEMTFWFADSGWAQIGDPDFSYADGVYTITTKDATSDPWQGQCTIKEVPLNIEGGEYYDIACKVVANVSVDRFTVKVNKDPDVDGDPNALFAKTNVVLKKGENILRFAKVTGMNGNDPVSFDQAKLIFDLGGTPADVTIQISDIIIQKHNPK